MHGQQNIKKIYKNNNDCFSVCNQTDKSQWSEGATALDI